MAAIREWYGGYNIIYNWFERKYGYEELKTYWHYLAEEVYKPLLKDTFEAGPQAIADYFHDIIESDEGKVETAVDGNSVTVEILECPDYIWQHHFSDMPYGIADTAMSRRFSATALSCFGSPRSASWSSGSPERRAER